MNQQQHRSAAFRSLMRFHRRADVEDKEKLQKPLCPLLLTDLEMKMYTNCPKCGNPVSRHRTLVEKEVEF